MKKIILATAISALFSTSVMAATDQYVAKGDLNFVGYVTNTPCLVTVDNGVAADGASATGDKIVDFTISLAPITIADFSAATPNLPIPKHEVDFTLKATGSNCDNATLYLSNDKGGETQTVPGVLIAKDGTKKLPLMLRNKDASAPAHNPVTLTGAAKTEIKPLLTGPGATADAAFSDYKFKLNYYNDGSAIETGKYTSTISYTIEND